MSGFLGHAPTWVSPEPDGLALTTVTVAYHPIGIIVSASGNFSFTAHTHGMFDNIEFLYNSTFNPTAPLTGLIRGVDAVGFGGTEVMSAIPLTSNTLYYVVTTSFNPTAWGPIILNFSGPSSVTQIHLPSLPGDYNFDGRVDGADYVVWRSTFGAKVTFFAGADGNGSGTIDNGDYEVLRANFGRPSGSGGGTVISAEVPEPSTGFLMLAGIVALYYATVTR
jgi:hypothetical protein